MEDVDTVPVKAVTHGGLRLELDLATHHEHLGEIFRVGGGAYASEHSVAFRADVALLSHNVVIQGDSMSELDRHGVHIMLHSRAHASIVDRSQGESLTARIENVEVRFAGQMGRLGRYPVHFHMIGAVRGSYVRGCAIHHTYNRAIAIHGVHYLRVQNNGALEPSRPTSHSPPLTRHLQPPTATSNPHRRTSRHPPVAFENRGHAYFVEDGLETHNVISGNLGASTRPLFNGLSTDTTPATFWYVNGDNYVEGNIAAGSSHYGHWFFPEPKVRGTSLYLPSPLHAGIPSPRSYIAGHLQLNSPSLPLYQGARCIRVRAWCRSDLPAGHAHTALREQRGAQQRPLRPAHLHGTG